MNEVTRILSAIEQGDRQAADQLLPLVYEELRKLAAQKLAHEKPGQTLDATALVHEAYLRLVASPAATAPGELGALTRPRAPEFANRGHFFVAAAEAMRRILIEQARRKQRERHGGGRRRLELLDPDLAVPERDEQVLFLDEPLTRLAGIRPQAAKLVQLRFFSGLTVEEAAPILDISPRTARRIWVFARAWLRREMDALADR
jgi:RNA polymerase sigma factor (sigma-70 family)